MVFKSDKQRKAFFANQRNIRASINPTLEIKAKKIFGITKNPLTAGFITRDGKFIQLKGEKEKFERFHKRIRVVFTEKQLKMSKLNAVDRFTRDTGNLRIQVTPKQSAIEAKRKLTPEQLNAIRKTQLNSNPIFFELTRREKILKSGKFIDFSNFVRFIKRNKLIIKNGN